MLRMVLAMGMVTAFAGCSQHMESADASRREEIPKVTREEFAEAQQHLYGVDGADAARYMESVAGRQLVAKRSRSVFGDLGRETLQGATRVETFLLIPSKGGGTASTPIDKIEGYPVYARGKEPGPDSVTKLPTYFLRGELYFVSPDCYPQPGVAYRLWDGPNSVTLILCYECYHLDVVVRDARGARIRGGGAYFHDPLGRPDVLRGLAKQAFPGIPEIQEL